MTVIFKKEKAGKWKLVCSWLPGARGGGNEEILIKGYKLLLCKMSKFWRAVVQQYDYS